MEARLIFLNNIQNIQSHPKACYNTFPPRRWKEISPLSAISTQEAALFYLEIEYAGGAHVAHIEVESLLTQIGWHLHERARA